MKPAMSIDQWLTGCRWGFRLLHEFTYLRGRYLALRFEMEDNGAEGRAFVESLEALAASGCGVVIKDYETGISGYDEFDGEDGSYVWCNLMEVAKPASRAPVRPMFLRNREDKKVGYFSRRSVMEAT